MIPFTCHLYSPSTFPPHLETKNWYLGTMLASILKTTTLICKSMDQLKQIHLQTIVKGVNLDPYVCFKIIASFCGGRDRGSVDYARQVFDKIPEPKVFLWNMMIKGYSSTSSTGNAIALYIEMLRRNVKPDNYTFPFLLKGFTRSVGLEIGKGIHCHVCKSGFGFGSNAAVDTSLIHMYSLCGNVDDARQVFDTSSKSDVIAWNIMIAGYNRSKLFDESRRVFREMEARRVVPTSVTLVSMLSACSKLKDSDGCKHVHRYVKEGRVKTNVVLNNALIDTYAACGEMDAALVVFDKMKTRDVISWTVVLSGFLNAGKLDVAREFFDQMPERDSVSWTAMIDGYVRQNRFKEGLMLFKNMQDAKVEPDEFTIVSVLTACANTNALDLGVLCACTHTGMVEEGRKFFASMTIDHGLEPEVEHYGCMVDLLGRAGLLAEAYNAIITMPMAPNSVVWRALLGGCGIHKDVDLAEFLLD